MLSSKIIKYGASLTVVVLMLIIVSNKGNGLSASQISASVAPKNNSSVGSIKKPVKVEIVTDTQEYTGYINHYDKPSGVEYFLLTDEGKEYSLQGEQLEQVSLNGKVRITGKASGSSIEVESLEALKDDKKSSIQVVLGPKKIAVLAFHFSDNQAQPLTIDNLKDWTFGNDPSLASYIAEVSFNQVQVSGDAYGWYTLPYLMGDTCLTQKWTNDVLSIARNQGVDIDSYDYIGLYFIHADCRFDGRADILNSVLYMNGTMDKVNYIAILAHELTHLFGIRGHANSASCTKNLNSNILVPISPYCSSEEYGDPTDVMGWIVSDAEMPYHMNAFFKNILGWFKPENVKFIQENGLYTLRGLENIQEQPQLLVVPIFISPLNHLRSYVVDLRRSVGLDRSMPKFGFNQGIHIRLAPRSDQLRTGPTNLIDTKISGWNDDHKNAALTEGKKFVDSVSGVSIKLVSLSAKEAKVEVKFGKPMRLSDVLKKAEIEKIIIRTGVSSFVKVYSLSYSIDNDGVEYWRADNTNPDEFTLFYTTEDLDISIGYDRSVNSGMSYRYKVRDYIMDQNGQPQYSEFSDIVEVTIP